MTAATRWAAVLVGALLLARAPQASADSDEASAHGQVIGGVVRATEGGAVGVGSILGVGGRFTLARSDLWAFEVQGMGLRAAPRFDGMTIVTGGTPITGTLDRTYLGGRLELGAHLRFGARWIPTLHAAIGVQARWAGETSLRDSSGMALTGVGATSSTDITAALSVGVDRRLGRSLVVGVSLGGVHAFPIAGDGGGFDALELTAHVAGYWYPGWLPLAGWRGSTGGDD